MQWGQAPSSAWPGDVAWVRRLHAVEEGTPYFRVPTVAPGPASGEDTTLLVGPESYSQGIKDLCLGTQGACF
jgi:hypothetical protein